MVLDLPTTDGELEPAAAIPRCFHRKRIILHVVVCVSYSLGSGLGATTGQGWVEG